MNRNGTLIILVGGASRRMGRPKHLLETADGTLIESMTKRLSPLFRETLLVGREIGVVPEGIRFVEDLRLERSPLVGIYSGLCRSRTVANFVVGCDMPFVEPDLIGGLFERSVDADVTVPVVNGFYEPLCAVYRHSCISAIERALDMGCLKTTSFYPDVRVREMSEQAVCRFDPGLVSFTNLNTPKQLALLARL